jgi:heat shock protein beta
MFCEKLGKVAFREVSTMFCICSYSNLVHTNMYRIMKAQTLGDTSHMDFMRGQRILEINPNHPIVQDLKVGVLMNNLWT